MTASPPDLSALLPIIAKARDLDGPRKFVRGQLEDLLESSSPPKRVHRLCEELRERIANTLVFRWFDAKLSVQIFGSFAQGLATNDSDLDLCIVDPNPPDGAGGDAADPKTRKRRLINGLPEWYDVETLAKVIEDDSAQQLPGIPAWQMRFSDIRAIPTARIPIVTFRAHQKDFEIKVDICVNNPVGRAKTSLIREYVHAQPELLPLMYHGVKAWLKYEGLNDPAPTSGPRSLSSFAIKLMVINFLQEEKFLPNLQDPLLLDNLRIPRDSVAYHSETGPKGPQRTACNTSHFRPSIDVQNFHKVTYPDLGWKFRYYRHETELHRGAPMRGSDWLAEGDKTEAEYRSDKSSEPPNRVGLHCIEGRGDYKFLEIEEMFPVFFAWLSGKVFCGPDGTYGNPNNEGPEALARKRIFQVNRLALPTAGRWSNEWLRAPLIMQDPFLRDRNILSGVNNFEVIDKLQDATERALDVVSHNPYCKNLQPLWTDVRLPPRKKYDVYTVK